MEKRKNSPRLTSFQLFSLLLGGMLGFGALNISRFASFVIGRDGWISVLFGGVIIIINSFIMIKLGNRFPGKTIIQYSEEIIGKVLGKALGFIFVVSAICISGLTLAVGAFVINSWILTFTPPYALYVTIILACFYVCLKDLKVLGRVSELLFFAHLIFFILFLPPVAQTGNYMNILPVAKSGWINIFSEIPSVLYCFAGYELISIYYAFSEDKKKSSKSAIWSVVVIVFVYTFAVITQIILFPLDYLQKLWVPSVNFISSIQVPFLERLDIIFVISWLYVFFKVISSYYYAATIEIQQIFNIKNRKMICLFIAPVIFIVAFFSSGINQIDSFTYVATSYTIALSLTVPMLLLVVSLLRRKGKNK